MRTVEVPARTEDDSDDLRMVFRVAREVGPAGLLFVCVCFGDEDDDADQADTTTLPLAYLQARMVRLYVAAMEGCAQVCVTVVPPLGTRRRPRKPADYLPELFDASHCGACSQPSSSLLPVSPPPFQSWALPPLPTLCGGAVQSPQQLHACVCLGGTFDRLHAGHRLMLSVAALLCTDTLYVGLTESSLLRSKRHREMIQPFEVRRAAVIACVSAFNPALRCVVAPLTDPWGPSVVIENITAIVVSPETQRGAEQINAKRAAEHSFAPLQIIVIAYVPPPRSLLLASCDSKLSSTALRNHEAAASSVPD